VTTAKPSISLGVLGAGRAGRAGCQAAGGAGLHDGPEPAQLRLHLVLPAAHQARQLLAGDGDGVPVPHTRASEPHVAGADHAHVADRQQQPLQVCVNPAQGGHDTTRVEGPVYRRGAGDLLFPLARQRPEGALAGRSRSPCRMQVNSGTRVLVDLKGISRSYVPLNNPDNKPIERVKGFE
jgi:hypothetical protein